MLRERLRGLGAMGFDFRDPGAWPFPARAAAFVSALVLVLGVGYPCFLAGGQQRLEMLQRQEAELRGDYERNAAGAAELPGHRARTERLGREAATLLEQFPRETEIPGLLEDLSRAAAASRLLVRSIDLQPEHREGFYVELPVALSMEGAYHDVVAFASRVARLPRIVTLHDFDLGGMAPDTGVRMNVVARAYRYPGSTEEAQ